MRSRRTAIVPHTLLRTAVASILPISACGGSAMDTDRQPATHGGMAGQGGTMPSVGGVAGMGGTPNAGTYGFIVLGGAFGGVNGGASGKGGQGGTEVLLGGAAGQSEAGFAGESPTGSAGFIALAAAAFGGAKP